ncbi:MAG: M23 family metallopeptidase [Clostridiaceae bacterium]
MASTASVRGALADENAVMATPTPTPPTALTTLQSASGTGTDASASYAAELLRWEQGLISTTSREAKRTKNQTVIDSFLAAGRAVDCALNLNLTEWAQALEPFEPTVYDSYAQRAAAFETLSQRVNEAIQSASAAAMNVLSRDLRRVNVPLYAGGQQNIQFNWKECAALYYAFGEDMTAVIAKAAAPQRQGNVTMGITLEWADPTFDEIASAGTREQLMEARYALTYLNTVYNDDGSVAEVEHFVYPAEYLKTVAHPLPGGTIKNGWYDPRSHRTRLHMGTDILAKRLTPILSATDGVVLYIGYMPIPGNFVIIRDPYGYEYHYYHMFEISTFVTEGQTVKQGDQIGRVGSTGNSVAYHLHVGVVSPDNRYLNPYDLFVQAGIGPIQPDETP